MERGCQRLPLTPTVLQGRLPFLKSGCLYPSLSLVAATLLSPTPTPVPASLWPSVPSQQPSPNGDFPGTSLLVSGAPPDTPGAVHTEWSCERSLCVSKNLPPAGMEQARAELAYSWWHSTGGQSSAPLQTCQQPFLWAPQTAASSGKITHWFFL